MFSVCRRVISNNIYFTTLLSLHYTLAIVKGLSFLKSPRYLIKFVYNSLSLKSALCNQQLHTSVIETFIVAVLPLRLLNNDVALTQTLFVFIRVAIWYNVLKYITIIFLCVAFNVTSWWTCGNLWAASNAAGTGVKCTCFNCIDIQSVLSDMYAILNQTLHRGWDLQSEKPTSLQVYKQRFRSLKPSGNYGRYFWVCSETLTHKFR
jgi:hypothetical protein